ncbi:MAG: hypothetical protein IIZ18_06190 [Ruminococcus sp.]|nr:hypothetical protein [Ruminococcus sp.]
MKKVLSALSAALIALGAVPVAAGAAEKVYEFESGTVYDTGDNVTQTVSLSGASSGKAIDLRDAGDSVTLKVTADSAGVYKLNIRYSQPYDEGGKYQDVIVNGQNVGQILCGFTGEGKFSNVGISAALRAGENTVTVQGSWGWTFLDCLTAEAGSSAGTSVSGSLSNPNASAQTRSLYSFLCDTYGKHVISGQQESTWMGSENYEFDIIKRASGKYPALRGLDYMGDDFSGCNRRAKSWYQQGGIVTICWHCGSDFSGSHTESMNSELNWSKALTEGTAEYNALIAGMDKGAKALLELKEAGVPVIWRPFHEFDGKWFWWGKGGAENFKKLWRIMYDRYTNYWGLDNLIWNLGYCGDVNDGWYPGDEYVDIIGADTYVNHTDSLVGIYSKTAQVAQKPVCLHENGPIPDPDKLEADGSKWLWFMTWHTSFIDSNEINTASYLNKVYNSDYLLTLDELPDVYHYQSDQPEVPETVRGDLNGDGQFSVADVVLLEKWLLGVPDTTLADWSAGDLWEDGKLDVYDLAEMREMLAGDAEVPANVTISPEDYVNYASTKIASSLPAGMADAKSGVDYGEMKSCTYYSTTRERNTPVRVLLPAGYSENEKYPVLYMLHGYWNDETTLSDPDSGLQNIMGNLIASGEAEKMIVVFPYIYTSKDMPYCTNMDAVNNQNYDNFIYDLQADLMPYIEKNFSVKTGRENTAISGFSMGARESLYIGVKMSDRFGYVGSVCTAPGVAPGMLSEKELRFGTMPYMVMISAAVYDGVVGNNPENYHNILTANGVQHIWNQLPYGGHDNNSIQPHFYNFTRNLFHTGN